MRVLEIIPVLDEGGAERFVADLCNSLAEHHEVSLMLLYPIYPYGTFCNELKGVNVHSLNKHEGFSLKYIWQVFKFIKDNKPDIVHSHLNSIVYLIFSAIFYRKAKYIHTVHNDAEKEAGSYLNLLVRKFLFRSNLVTPVTISKASNESFYSVYNMKAPIIHNGCPEYSHGLVQDHMVTEFNALKYNQGSKLIVNVARISEQKNQLTLIKAINELNQEGYKIELAIIGPCVDDTQRERLNSVLTPQIHLLGVRDNPRDYMQIADAFCLSSTYEGMPITLIEAFSVGALPLCTPVGGIVNMIQDGYNGLLFTGSDKSSIKIGLKRYLKLTESQIYNIKIHSKLSYSKYTITESRKQYECLMHELR